MRRWKLALSLALVAALIAPFVAGTWKLREGRWVPLSAEDKASFSSLVEETKGCTSFPPDKSDYAESICTVVSSTLRAGGQWDSGERMDWRYVAKNLRPMIAAFCLTFLLAMILPSIGSHYWSWLRR